MSTVHICLNDIFGVAVACEVIFYPGDTPFFSGAALAVSGARSIRLDADGNGSVTLLPGRYAVRFSGITSNTDTLLILVPNDNEDYPLSVLICGGNWVLPMRDFLQTSRNLSDVADPAAAFAAIKQHATAASGGVVCLATQAEVDAGTDPSKCVTPATLANAARAKLVSVPDAAARFALTPAQVNPFDEVEQLDTRAMYQVLDTESLAQERGYVQIGTRAEGDGLAYGLVAWWKLDEESGTRVDATGNGHDLTDINGVGFEAGTATFTGAHATFSGGQYLSFPTPIAQIPGDWTIATKFQFASLDEEQTVVDDGTRILIVLPESRLLRASFHFDPNNWAHALSEFAIDTNPHHAAWVRNGSTFTLYLDGVSISSADCGSEVVTSFDGRGFTIGMAGSYGSFLSGNVGPTAIWNRALSDAEVAQLAAGATYPV